MNRIKALVMHEIRLMKWLLAVGVFVALLFCLALKRNTGGYIWGLIDWSVNAGSCFSEVLLDLMHDGHIFVWIAFAVFTFLQFRDFHGRKTREYMTSLPFTVREHFVVKALMGYAVILVSWLVMTIGTLLVWNSEITGMHKKSLLYPVYNELLANETIWHTLRTLGVFGLELLAAYSLFLLLHAMVNNGGIASLFTLGAMVVPAELCYLANSVWVRAGGVVPDDVGGWEHLARLFAGDSLAMMHGRYGEWGYGNLNWYTYILYWNMWEVVIILLLILAVCTVAAWRLAKGLDLAGRRNLVPHKGARLFLSIVIGVCAGSAIAEILPIVTEVVFSVLGFFVVLIAGSVILSFAVYKLLKISVR